MSNEELQEIKRLVGIKVLWGPTTAREIVEKLLAALEASKLEVERLKGERDEADRRAGASERELAFCQDKEMRRNDWLRKAKKEAGYVDGQSFDIVWAETLAKANRAEAAERALAAAQERVEELEKARAKENAEYWTLAGSFDAERQAHEQTRKEQDEAIKEIARVSKLLGFTQAERDTEMLAHAETKRDCNKLATIIAEKSRELAALKARIDSGLEVWVCRVKDGDDHWACGCEPSWDEEYEEWRLDGDTIYLGEFASGIAPGDKKCVKLVFPEEPDA